MFPHIVAAIVAQATPAPKATQKPRRVSTAGFVRSYYFTRTNASSFVSTNSQFNQASFNTAVSLQSTYPFDRSWSVGAAYLYADGLNGCGNPQAHVDPASPCYRSRKFTSPQGGTNPDDTLPGFRLNTLYEAYLQYNSPAFHATLGDQVINTPWANASDSRLKPVAFEGIDSIYRFAKNWTSELAYVDRWEDRVQSAFVASNMLTENGSYPDSPGVGNTGIPKGQAVGTGGFLYGSVAYHSEHAGAGVHYYAFQDVANAIWAEGRYSWSSYARPYIAVQAGAERIAGSSIAGKIDSRLIGLQTGISPWKNVDLAISYDYVPARSETINLTASASCSASGIVSGTLPYFLPAGGTPDCRNNADGTATVYYGGWASPYTDGYATDPVFTTSISQGMVDRRSPGSSAKIAATFHLFGERVKFAASRAWYRYGNAAGVSPTQETNLDAIYYMNPLRTGRYRGFSLRHRYAERTQANTAIYGGLPIFKYNRTQLEYDF